jgi:hypothetical protein
MTEANDTPTDDSTDDGPDVRGYGVPTDADPETMHDAVDGSDGVSGTEQYRPHVTTYEGLFGWLCEHVPPLDADAPAGWLVAYRAWHRTTWYHADADVAITCANESDGWAIYVVEHDVEQRRQVLPRNASRRRAYGAVGSFFEGEPLLVADPEHGADGLITLDRLGISE